MLTESLRHVLRDTAAAMPGVELALVFGSTARGTARPGSDLDLAVLGEVDTLELAGRMSIATAREADVADRVARARAHARQSAAELAADRDALDLVAFNRMLAIQSCADIASHIIADEGWPPASTLADGFARLAERGVVTDATRRALTRAVGFRNVVAHGYAGF